MRLLSLIVLFLAVWTISPEVQAAVRESTGLTPDVLQPAVHIVENFFR